MTVTLEHYESVAANIIESTADFIIDRFERTKYFRYIDSKKIKLIVKLSKKISGIELNKRDALIVKNIADSLVNDGANNE